MSSYSDLLAKWFEEGKVIGHDYMLVIYGTNNRQEPFTPIYASEQNVHHTVALENGIGGSGAVREVFDLRLPIERLEMTGTLIRDDKDRPTTSSPLLRSYRSHPDGNG
jgi:hypothetical protein